MPETKSCPACEFVSSAPAAAELVCMLEAGHDGLHYDSIDDISWIAGNAHEMKTHDQGTSYCTRQPEHEGDPRCLS